MIQVNGNLNDLVHFYKPQVDMYARYWAEMTNEPIKEAGLYFVDIQKWVII